MHVRDTRNEVHEAVALEIAELVRDRAARGLRTVLGFATGGTMSGLYESIVALHRAGTLDMSSVIGFNLDEYLDLAAGSDKSFRTYMHRALYDHVNVPVAGRHVPDAELARLDCAAYCKSYEAAIRAAGGIDLQLLGVGRNGHVAFNEPGSARDSRTRLIDLDERTRSDAEAYFGAGRVPLQAVTMGVGTILEARRIRVLAFGQHKAEAVAATVHGPVTSDVPASFLRDHAGVEMWLDPAAAAGIDVGSRVQES